MLIVSRVCMCVGRLAVEVVGGPRTGVTKCGPGWWWVVAVGKGAMGVGRFRVVGAVGTNAFVVVVGGVGVEGVWGVLSLPSVVRLPVD